MSNSITVVGLGSKMQVGKDTTADYWVQTNPRIVRRSFAKKLKEMVKDLYGLDESYVNGDNKPVPLSQFGGVTSREIMQKFGSLNREIYSNIWIDYVFRDIQILPAGSVVIITDCRFENEAVAIKNAGGFVVNIVRDTSSFNISSEQRNHISETSLDGYDFDFVIDNSSDLEGLYKKADIVMQDILKLKRG